MSQAEAENAARPRKYEINRERREPYPGQKESYEQRKEAKNGRG